MKDSTHESFRYSRNVAPVSRWYFIAVVAFLTTVLSPQALSQPAFPGAAGFGVETTHGRGGVVCRVTNTNDSGAGSLRTCLAMTVPRIVVFTTSGTIYLDTPLQMGAAHSNVAVFGQTSPGGIAITTAPGNIKPLLELSYFKAGDPAGAFHDGLFQHLRFRHGSRDETKVSVSDNIVLYSGTHHVVFDHVSFTWSGDESYSFWQAGGNGDMHDITFSHTIHGASAYPPPHPRSSYNSKGPLLSGGREGDYKYNMTFHHNLGIFVSYRDWKISGGGSSGTSNGVQFMNNVHYGATSQHYAFANTQYNSCTAIMADVINDYFKDSPGQTRFPYYSADACQLGKDKYSDDRFCTAACNYINPSLYLKGSTWRDSNGNVQNGGMESDNYSAVRHQYSAAPITKRATPIPTQPIFPVIITSAARAYTDIIIYENVGALPLDDLDQELVNAPEIGGTWTTKSVPAPHGSRAYPTLSGAAYTDDDNDGVPDDYETNVLGTDPSVFEPQAVLDHDGDGYTNIEEWSHSLSDSVARVPAESTPNPPLILPDD